VLIAPHPRTRATSRSSSPNRVCHSYSLVKQHVFLRSCGAVLRPGFVSFASRIRIEGWRSAERRTDTCEASGGPALTGQARHLARRLASPTGDARLPALHRGDFGLRSRASFTSICAGSVQRAPRSQVVVPGGRGPGPAGTAVMSRRRDTPRLAPPSGSSPEMPLDERHWNLCILASFCSQAQNAVEKLLRPEFENAPGISDFRGGRGSDVSWAGRRILLGSSRARRAATGEDSRGVGPMSAWGIGLYASDFALDLRATVGAVARLPLDEDKLVAAISRPRKLPPKIPPTRIWLVLADQFEKRLCPPYSAAALTDEVNNKLRSFPCKRGPRATDCCSGSPLSRGRTEMGRDSGCSRRARHALAFLCERERIPFRQRFAARLRQEGHGEKPEDVEHPDDGRRFVVAAETADQAARDDCAVAKRLADPPWSRRSISFQISLKISLRTIFSRPSPGA
jgi:hypothetical protein